MNLSNDSVKHCLLGLWPAILASFAIVAAGSVGMGCIIHEHGHDDDDDDWGDHSHGTTEEPADQPESKVFSIETDQVIEAEPGEGVGFFVEYAAGGSWRLWTTCDTNWSNQVCKFDAFVSVDRGSEPATFEGQDLDGYDEVKTLDNGGAQFHAETASDIDIMKVTAAPGAVLRVELLLDSVPDGRFIYWIGDGVVHQGAPTNPIDFMPTSP